MFWIFGKCARERRLIKGLRRRPLDPAVVAQVRRLTEHEQRGDIPSNLLWKMHVLARSGYGTCRRLIRVTPWSRK